MIDHAHPAEVAAEGGVRVRACVHAGAIARVTRFFNATLRDVFAELLQNARRAGAGRVDVSTEDDGDAIRVTVADDGAGVADPALLLSFGESGWDARTARDEDAAGMGLFSLARRGCVVASRRRAPDGGVPSAWSIALTPAHFLGEADAAAVPDPSPPPGQGASVSFAATEVIESIEATFAAEARHGPLEATFDGKTIARKPFLEGALRTERWRGLVFGVFRNRSEGYNEPDLNFHGLAVPTRLPRVLTVCGATWSVFADVARCPELELVLPARKEAVETPFLEEMRAAARLAIYRAMAATDPVPRLARDDNRRAWAAGVALPEPPAELRPWRPARADIDNRVEEPAFAPVGPDALVMAVDLAPSDAQALYRAARRSGAAERFFAPDKRFEGYDWYDALTRVCGVETMLVSDDSSCRLETLRAAARRGVGMTALPDRLDRPEAILLDIDTVRGDGDPGGMTLLADLVFIGEEEDRLDKARPIAIADTDLGPDELADLLRDAFFAPYTNYDADSWETQRARFDEEALHAARKLLVGADEALRGAIADIAGREIGCLVPRDRRVEVAFEAGKIAVTLHPAAPEANV